MQKLVKEAKEFAGIKPDTIIDERRKILYRESVKKYGYQKNKLNLRRFLFVMD